MEYWSFPPAYDDTYLPPADSPYWFPVRETMDPSERERAILVRLREVMRYAWEQSGFYRRKWEQAGIHPDHITSLEAFERVPVVTKAELRASQAQHPPFGDYLCVPDAEVAHIHGTSGTTGRPTAFAVGRADWQAIANNHARILWGMGPRPGDTVFVAAIFSLYLGSWGAMLGAERLGCRVFPFGAGAPGMTARAAQWLRLTRPRAFYSTPSYALRLAEVAAEEGLDPGDFGLEVMFFSGEPGASIPAVRQRIEEAFGARVFDCGTMAEMTPFMSAAATAGAPEGMLLWQDMVYHEICDPETFARVPYGQRGTPVYTHLERTSQPMIRLLSGDLSHWVDGPSPCGRTYPRLPDGVYGRIDDMFQVRGENVYPSEIDNVLNGIDGYGGEHRVVISREGTMDELLVQAEANEAVQAAGDAATVELSRRVAHELNKVLGLRARVEVVSPRSFPRSEHKARRVLDDRDLFRSLQAKLDG
ncbi:MAG: AMP-binding protein [Chloroflexi bacterium]|nr:AMP-binding protein [Chloroflexota bacterium]